MTLTLSLAAAALVAVANYVFKDTITSSVTSVFIASFLGLFVTAKLYQLFVYPYYFSPLRNIPGPKVLCSAE